MKKTLIATTALLATAGTTALVAAPAHADVERRGTCAGATYELNVDRERGGFEVDADIDNARVGSEWSVDHPPRRQGRHLAGPARRRRGRARPRHLPRNTAGKDVFKLT